LVVVGGDVFVVASFFFRFINRWNGFLLIMPPLPPPAAVPTAAFVVFIASFFCFENLVPPFCFGVLGFFGFGLLSLSFFVFLALGLVFGFGFLLGVVVAFFVFLVFLKLDV